MVLKRHIFHSKQLLPWEIAQKLREGKVDEVHEWCNVNWQHKFKPTDEVAEKSNPGHKMIVDRVVFKNEKVGERELKRIIGIDCFWWVDEKEIKEFKNSFD